MERKYTEAQRIYLRNLERILPRSANIIFLLKEIPVMSTEVYNKTTVLYAERAYEEAVNRRETIPHGFADMLGNSARDKGLVHTLKVYKKELGMICTTMKINLNEISNVLKVLANKNSKQNDIENAKVYLSNTIRLFNSKYRGQFIKNIIAFKNNILNNTSIKVAKEDKENKLTTELFLQIMLSNDEIKKRIKDMIYESFSKKVDDKTLKDLLIAGLNGDLEYIASLLDIEKPKNLGNATKEKKSRRLELNFEPELNTLFANSTLEHKEEFLKAMKIKVECHIAKNYEENEELNKLKAKLTQKEQKELETISVILAKSNSILTLDNGKFVFERQVIINDEDKQYIKEYEANIHNIKKIQDAINKFYNTQKNSFNSFMKTTEKQLKIGEGDIINRDKWLSIYTMKNLIAELDVEKIDQMNLDALFRLRVFLEEEGLLWTFLADNISAEIIGKIINKFETIYNNYPDLISIDSLPELIRKVNLLDYTNDLTIGLLGLNTLEKIINYNQFSGVTVTKEVIEKRIRKVIDLTVRSEYMDESSLPFNCSVKSGDYTLVRYLNNDPAIFTSGIDTKTCFFVSVNENDFFFYSLLSKDGYVIKILNQKNELIARATCFRKNNVLMINGIRYINNKLVPENNEELTEFTNLVKLIRLLAKKMIEITSKDECPIDYVVCNQAGILENEHFENIFEKINADLFREPINVYSEDWEKFVHTYDNEEEQLLQEVSVNPTHSFTTDFGSHYPAILIESRNNMGLLSPKDISYNDQEATYKRPRITPESYINEEIDEKILNKINRIRALSCFTGTKEEQKEKQDNYRLIKTSENIKNAIIGDDWCVLIDNQNNIETIMAKESVYALQEITDYVTIFYDDNDEVVKLYYSPKKNN